MSRLPKLRELARKAFISLLVSFGVLSIANVDSVWRERLHRDDFGSAKAFARKNQKAHVPATSVENETELSALENLSESLAQDELGEQNPFEAISNMGPLNAIFGRGVRAFQRQVFRSPDYRDEIGYDLISYDIEQGDHSHSTILAYLERPLVDGQPAELASHRQVVVLLLESRAGVAHQSLYKDGVLVGQADLTLSQAQALVSHKLNAGIPFFSVAR